LGQFSQIGTFQDHVVSQHALEIILNHPSIDDALNLLDSSYPFFFLSVFGILLIGGLNDRHRDDLAILVRLNALCVDGSNHGPLLFARSFGRLIQRFFNLIEDFIALVFREELELFTKLIEQFFTVARLVAEHNDRSFLLRFLRRLAQSDVGETRQHA